MKAVALFSVGFILECTTKVSSDESTVYDEATTPQSSFA